MGCMKSVMFRAFLCGIAIVAFGSCSIQDMALRALADSLSGSSFSSGDGGSPFTSDGDPKLIASSLPAFMKTLELVAARVPDHEGLAVTTGSLFVMYASAFVKDPATRMDSVADKQAELQRAKKLFLRGRAYLLPVLERRYPGFQAALAAQEWDGCVGRCVKADVDLMYWTAASWIGAFSCDPFDFGIMVEVPRAERIMARARDLDPGYSGGSIWDFYISFYATAPASLGGDPTKVDLAYQKALEYSKGESPSPYLSYALAKAVPEGNRALFEELVGKALAFDPDARPASRLPILLTLEAAKYNMDRIDELFPPDEGE